MSSAHMSLDELQQDVIGLLSRADIRKVAMIDDAYEVPRKIDIQEELDEVLIQVLDQGLDRDLCALCELSAEDDIADSRLFVDQHIQVMWQACTSNKQGELLELLRQDLFRKQLDSYRAVELIRETLSELEVEVQILTPQDEPLPRDEDIGMWLFDLFLDDRVEDDRGSSWHMAATLATDLFKNRGQLPFVVLMSSHDEGLEKHHTEFRETVDLPAGFFDILHKRSGVLDEDKKELLKWLRRLLDSAPLRKQVFNLVHAVENAVEGALKRYKRHLRDLAHQDYAHIFRYSIEEDGHPLGDYILWLLEPLFEHHLRESEHVEKARASLDQLTGEDIPLYDCLERDPSSALGHIHRLRLWARAQPLTTNAVHGLIRLHQGDLLVSKKDASRVFLVLNASCDLAFAETGTSRIADRDLSLILLPGAREDYDIENQKKASIAFTDFYQQDSDGTLVAKRIRWQLGKAITRPYSAINEGEYIREWTLRRPFTLELVQQWSRHVTRIGLPVAPPVIKGLWVRVFARDGLKAPFQPVEVSYDKPHAYLFRRGKVNKFVFARRFIGCLKEMDQGLSGIMNALADELELRREHEFAKSIHSGMAQGKAWMMKKSPLDDDGTISGGDRKLQNAYVLLILDGSASGDVS